MSQVLLCCKCWNTVQQLKEARFGTAGPFRETSTCRHIWFGFFSKLLCCERKSGVVYVKKERVFFFNEVWSLVSGFVLLTLWTDILYGAYSQSTNHQLCSSLNEEALRIQGFVETLSLLFFSPSATLNQQITPNCLLSEQIMVVQRMPAHLSVLFWFFLSLMCSFFIPSSVKRGSGCFLSDQLCHHVATDVRRSVTYRWGSADVGRWLKPFLSFSLSLHCLTSYICGKKFVTS